MSTPTGGSSEPVAKGLPNASGSSTSSHLDKTLNVAAGDSPSPALGESEGRVTGHSNLADDFDSKYLGLGAAQEGHEVSSTVPESSLRTADDISHDDAAARANSPSQVGGSAMPSLLPQGPASSAARCGMISMRRLAAAPLEEERDATRPRRHRSLLPRGGSVTTRSMTTRSMSLHSMSRRSPSADPDGGASGGGPAGQGDGGGTGDGEVPGEDSGEASNGSRRPNLRWRGLSSNRRDPGNALSATTSSIMSFFMNSGSLSGDDMPAAAPVPPFPCAEAMALGTDAEQGDSGAGAQDAGEGAGVDRHAPTERETVASLRAGEDSSCALDWKALDLWSEGSAAEPRPVSSSERSGPSYGRGIPSQEGEAMGSELGMNNSGRSSRLSRRAQGADLEGESSGLPLDMAAPAPAVGGILPEANTLAAELRLRAAVEPRPSVSTGGMGPVVQAVEAAHQDGMDFAWCVVLGQEGGVGRVGVERVSTNQGGSDGLECNTGLPAVLGASSFAAHSRRNRGKANEDEEDGAQEEDTEEDEEAGEGTGIKTGRRHGKGAVLSTGARPARVSRVGSRACSDDGRLRGTLSDQEVAAGVGAEQARLGCAQDTEDEQENMVWDNTGMCLYTPEDPPAADQRRGSSRLGSSRPARGNVGGVQEAGPSVPRVPSEGAFQEQGEPVLEHVSSPGEGIQRPNEAGSRMVEWAGPGREVETDVLHKIFSALDHRTLGRASAVCRQWREVSGHAEFWRHVDLRGMPLRPATMEALCRRQTQIESLDLRGCFAQQEKLEQVGLRALPRLALLSRLELGGVRVPNTFLGGLSVMCRALRVLRVEKASLGLDRLAVAHDHLEQLELVDCSMGMISLTCPSLGVLSLHRSLAFAAELRCPQLHSLDLSQCAKFSEGSLQSSATACPGLRNLKVAGCSCVSDDLLFAVGQQCSSLEALDASDCPNVSLDRTPPWPSLTSLTLQRCTSVSAMALRMLSRCPTLATLDLEGCLPLAVANLEMDSLASLSLANCVRLAELSVSSPELEALNLRACCSLKTVRVDSASLPELSLQGQMYLSQVALGCPSLQRLELVECPSLTDSLFESLAVRGATRCLRELRLDYCESLANVRLQAEALSTCSLVGCKGLVQLSLECPSLTSLFLEGCIHLETAELQGVCLPSLNLGICPRLSAVVISSLTMQSLELGGCGSLAKLTLDCPELELLDAQYCQSLTDESLLPLPTACPSVATLILASCPNVGMAGLASLGSLGSLTSLDLSYTFLTSLGPVFESCTKLQVLKLSACKYLSDLSLLPLSGNAPLVVGASSSGAAGESSTGQKGVLAVAAARRAGSSSSEAGFPVTADGGSVVECGGPFGIMDPALPQLTELDISYTSFTARAAEHLFLHCPRLLHISLSGCHNITDSIWACLSAAPQAPAGAVAGSSSTAELAQAQAGAQAPAQQPGADSSSSAGGQLPGTQLQAGERALRSLILVGCSKLRSLELACDKASPFLASLNLNWAKNLGSVSLTCSSLQVLHLSHCESLKSLSLRCPRLTSLFLPGCPVAASALEESVRGCPMLETLDIRHCTQVDNEVLGRIRSGAPHLKRIYS